MILLAASRAALWREPEFLSRKYVYSASLIMGHSVEVSPNSILNA
jgi:hypothetical protein